MTKHVAIFGAGVAGLTAAHEFAKRGYRVSVFERNEKAGGFFRSARRPEDGMPTEYSWHGFGPWYHNTFSLLQEIPFDDQRSLYDVILSRPIEYAVVPDRIEHGATPDDFFEKPRAFNMTFKDKIWLFWGILKSWSVGKRSVRDYSQINAAAYWEGKMSKRGHQTWRALFGPWIGSDWPYASLHHVGLFFGRNLFSGPPHHHSADAEGPAWAHEAGGGWSLLRGPSNEAWFNPWVGYLHSRGVEFHWETPLERLDHDGGLITNARVGGKNVAADVYVLATTPFHARDLLEITPSLKADPQLSKLPALVQDGPHTQVSFRIAFAEPMAWPRERTAVALTDSAFDITLFATEQCWPSDIDLGEGVTSLWTCTACVASIRGPVHGKPLATCTKEQFIDEVLAQIRASDALDFMIRSANGGRGLLDFEMSRIEVWDEWQFSQNGIQPDQPKWVTTTNTRWHRPNQRTAISNLVLAGAHTETQADIWSIEGAIESGLRAVGNFEKDVTVIDQHKPSILRVTSRLDDYLFKTGFPHILKLLAFGSITMAALWMMT